MNSVTECIGRAEKALTFQRIARLAAVGLLLGCGERADLPPLFPVQGLVRKAGKPLAGAMVTLHPRAASVEHTQKPIAYSDANGQFAMSSYSAGDGAPAGEYAITVELRTPRTVGEEVIRDGQNLLPARYANPATSPLSASVTEGDNKLPPIDIASR